MRPLPRSSRSSERRSASRSSHLAMTPMTRRLALRLWALTSVVSALAVAQGDSGFMAGEGRLFTALSYQRDVIDAYRVDGGLVPLESDLVREYVSFFAAYGLTEDFELSGSLSYATSSAGSGVESAEESGLGDLYLAGRWRAHSQRLGAGRLSLLLAPGIKLPVGDYDAQSPAAIGSGQTDLLGRVVAQYLFEAGTFAALETGYDVRTEDPPDEIPLNLTLGHSFDSGLSLAAFYTRVDSRGVILRSATPETNATPASGSGTGSQSGSGSGQGSPPPPQTGLQGDYEQWGLSASMWLTDELSLSLGYRQVLEGASAWSGDGLWIGLGYSWD